MVVAEEGLKEIKVELSKALDLNLDEIKEVSHSSGGSRPVPFKSRPRLIDKEKVLKQRLRQPKILRRW